jgi:hypothetical protein
LGVGGHSRQRAFCSPLARSCPDARHDPGGGEVVKTSWPAADAPGLDWALFWLAHDWPIVPMDADQRRPLVAGFNAPNWKPTKADVRKWWRRWPDADVAATTRGRLILDADAHDAGELPFDDGVAAWRALREELGLPLTALHRTSGGRGGWHEVWRLNGEVFRSGKLVPGVDVKTGPGSLVRLPGSRGVTIAAWAEEREVPSALAERLREAQAPTTPHDHRDRAPDDHEPGPFTDTPYGLAALQEETGKLGAKLPETGRNIQFNESVLKLAHLVAGGHLTRSTMEGRIKAIARRVGVDEPHVRSTFESAFGAGSKQPRGPKAARQADRRLQLVKASTIKPRPVRFLWAGRVPVKGLTLLAGQQGDGKSTLSLDLAARASVGRLEGEHRGSQAASLFMTTEDDWESVIVPRLMVAGADLGLVHAVYVDRERQSTSLVLPDDAEILAEAFEEAGARFAVIDPLLAHIGHGFDTHKDQHVRQVTTELDRVAQAHDAAVLGLVHFTKAVDVKDILYRVMGSQGLTAAARSVLGVFKDESAPKSDRLLVHIKSNWSAYADTEGFTIVQAPAFANEDGEAIYTSRLEWTGPRPEIDRFNVLSASGTDLSDEASELLVLLAQDGPLTPAEVHVRRKSGGTRSASATRHLLGKLLERGLVRTDETHRYEVVEGASGRLF